MANSHVTKTLITGEMVAEPCSTVLMVGSSFFGDASKVIYDPLIVDIPLVVACLLANAD